MDNNMESITYERIGNCEKWTWQGKDLLERLMGQKKKEIIEIKPSVKTDLKMNEFNEKLKEIIGGGRNN